MNKRDSVYTKPELRAKLKERIQAANKGGHPGQWSARKSQLLVQAYEKAGGGYTTSKRTIKQRNLEQWEREEWTTSDGGPAARKGGTTRYLPKKAWQKMSPGERQAANQRKLAGSRRGKQYVANTPAAGAARKAAATELAGKKTASDPVQGQKGKSVV